MDFPKINRPTSATQFMHRLKLTLWQAIDVNIKDGLLLAAAAFLKVINRQP